MSDTLTTSEAAELLGVSVATLKRWASAGLLPSSHTPGGHRRFRRGDVERHLSCDKAGRTLSRWIRALLEAEETLSVQAELYRQRVELGSWHAVEERFIHVGLELHRLRETEAITVAQWQRSFDFLGRGLTRFLAEWPPVRGAPALLVAAIPEDRILIRLYFAELCARELGWSVRWAGHLTPDDLVADLEREPADAVVINASIGSDPVVARELAAEYLAIAGRRRTPLGLLGAWPESVGAEARLPSMEAMRGWLGRARKPSGMNARP